jgi:hypothetical protein
MAAVQRALASVGRTFMFVAAAIVVIGAVLIAIAAAYAHFGGHDMQSSAASSLFIGGAVLVVWNGLAGGGTRGARYDRRVGLPRPSMPFAWVVIGLAEIGIGVLVVVL